METLLFGSDDLLDKFSFIYNFRVVNAHDFSNGWYELMKEWLIESKYFAVTYSTAQQSANHITASFIGRQHAITNGESNGADMVSDDFECNIVLFVHMIFHTGKFTCF